MECNRDEAILAKSMAEMKLEQEDFSGAHKLATKAQKLYPKIEGISKMLSMLDVYLSAERKVGGEVDWYGVLNVGPTADDEAINKQFKRLALEIHPDKNPSAGAAGAFKLISEAKCLLLDWARRAAHDRARAEVSGPSGPAQPDSRRAYAAGFPYFTFDAWIKGFPEQGPRARGKGPKKSARTGPNAEDLFWTICHWCGLEFQHRTIFRNVVIACLGCGGTFKAVEVQCPVNMDRAKPWTPHWAQAQGPTNFGPGESSQPQQPGPNNFGPGVFEAGSSSSEAAGASEAAAEEEKGATERAPNAEESNGEAEMDSVLKRRRMNEDEGGDRRRGGGSRGIMGCFDQNSESVYACW